MNNKKETQIRRDLFKKRKGGSNEDRIKKSISGIRKVCADSNK